MLTYNFTARNLCFINTHKSTASTHWNSLHGLTSSSPVRERLSQFTFSVWCLEFIGVTGRQEAQGLPPPAGGWYQLSENSERWKVTGTVPYDYMIRKKNSFISSKRRTGISQDWKTLKTSNQCASHSLCYIPFSRLYIKCCFVSLIS